MAPPGWPAALGLGQVVSNSQQLGIVAIVGWVVLAITALIVLLLVFSKGERHYFNSLFKMWVII